jgi:hypothetical protein
MIPHRRLRGRGSPPSCRDRGRGGKPRGPIPISRLRLPMIGKLLEHAEHGTLCPSRRAFDLIGSHAQRKLFLPCCSLLDGTQTLLQLSRLG